MSGVLFLMSGYLCLSTYVLYLTHSQSTSTRINHPGGKGQKAHNTRLLDRARQLPLVQGASAGAAARGDFGLRRNKLP